MLTKDTLRLIVLQIASFGALFSGISPRIAAGVQFLQTLCQPAIWDQIWGIAGPSGTATATAAGGAQAAQQGTTIDTSKPDPFDWLDDVAA